MNLRQLFLAGALSLIVSEGFLLGLDQYPSVEEAAFYDAHSQQQYDVAFKVLKRIDFCNVEQVLDIGCGSGKVTANIAGRVANGAVLGLDMSEGMIAYAQKTYQPYYANLSFAKGDILTYTNSSKFDLIISANSLHWVVDHQALLAQVYNLLKDQGSIYFTIPCKPFPEVSRIFNDSTGQEPWKTYLKDYNSPRRKFTPEEYTALLQEAGFNQIEVFQVPLTYRFETKRDLADWYAAFSPMLFYIPEEQHEAFLKSIVDRYLETFPLDEDGRILFKQNELIIKAKK